MSTNAVPEILWAQRSSASVPEKNVIMLTINVPNMTAEATKCDLTNTGLHFESTVQGDASKGIEGNKFTFDVEFYENIVPSESKQHLTSKYLYLVLRKEKAQDEYWPRLTKDKVRLHNVKTDFDKWVDEDEQDGEMNAGDDAGFDPSMLAGGGAGGMDLNSIMSSLGGAGGSPDLGAMGGDMDAGDDDDDEDDKGSEGKNPKVEETA